MTELTRTQKHALAAMVIRAAADQIAQYQEERDEGSYTPGFPEHEALKDVTWDQMTEQVARWLKALPGDSWDIRLPQV